MSVDNVSILSKADGTAVKVAPKTVVNLIGAFFLGLVIALIYVFFKVIFDKRIKDEEDVEKELGLPVLGSIQNLSKDGCYLCQKGKYDNDTICI